MIFVCFFVAQISSNVFYDLPQGHVLPNKLNQSLWRVQTNSFNSDQSHSYTQSETIFEQFYTESETYYPERENQQIYFLIDLGSEQQFQSFSLKSDQENSQIVTFELYIGNSSEEVRQKALSRTEYVFKGDINYETNNEYAYVDFEKAQFAQYVFILTLSDFSNFTSTLSEFNLYTDPFLGEIDRSLWIANANTYQSNSPGQPEGPPNNAIDGNLNTWWISNWNLDPGVLDRPPEEEYSFIYFNLGKIEQFGSFSITPRPNRIQFTDYLFFVGQNESDLLENFNKKKYVESGNFTFSNDGGQIKYLEHEYYSQYIGIASKGVFNTAERRMVSIDEFHLYHRFLGFLKRDGWFSLSTNMGSTPESGQYSIDDDFSTYFDALVDKNFSDFPHWVIYDRGNNEPFNGFVIFPRQDIFSGVITKFQIYSSNSISDFEFFLGRDQGEPNYEGIVEYKEITYNGQYYKLPNNITNRYVCICSLSSNDNENTFISEFYLTYQPPKIPEATPEPKYKKCYQCNYTSALTCWPC